MNKTNSSSPELTFILSTYSDGLTWDLYFRMVAAFFGLIANIINVCVFLNTQLADTTYKYMLANAITNLIYLLLSLISVFVYYCTECPSSQTYFTAYLGNALANYTLDSLKLMHVLLQIAISLRILGILLNRPIVKGISYKFVLVLTIIISVVYFLQEPFSYEIYAVQNQYDEIVYTTRFNQFGNSDLSKYLVLAQFVVRIFLAVFVLSFINTLNLIEFYKRLQNKRSLFKKRTSDHEHSPDNQHREENVDNASIRNLHQEESQIGRVSRPHKNLVLMVIYSSFMNAAGTLPYSIVYICQQVLMYQSLNEIYNISVVILYALLTLDTVIYYFSNKLYRNVLKDYVKQVRAYFN